MKIQARLKLGWFKLDCVISAWVRSVQVGFGQLGSDSKVKPKQTQTLVGNEISIFRPKANPNS